MKHTDSYKADLTLKWLICVIIAFVGNGICSTIQPEQSKIFDNKYDDTFMVIALAIVFVVLLVLALVKDRKVFLPTVKTNVHLMVLCGVSNAVANLLVMAATGLGVNKSLMFPLISVGGIVIAWVVSVFLYKEKLSKKQPSVLRSALSRSYSSICNSIKHNPLLRFCEAGEFFV